MQFKKPHLLIKVFGIFILKQALGRFVQKKILSCLMVQQLVCCLSWHVSTHHWKRTAMCSSVGFTHTSATSSMSCQSGESRTS